MPANVRNSELPALLNGDFYGRTDPVAAFAVSHALHMGLPALSGYWSGAARSATDQQVDQSGNGAHLDKAGSATWGYNVRLAPYMSFPVAAAVGNNFNRASDGYTAISTGLNMGGWFFPRSNAANYHIMGRWNSGALSYLLNYSAGVFGFYVSTTGAAVAAQVFSAAYSPNLWHRVDCRFIASTEISIFVNGVQVANTTSIPATLYTGGAVPFRIGASYSNGYYGEAAFTYLARTPFTVTYHRILYDAGRAIFA